MLVAPQHPTVQKAAFAPLKLDEIPEDRPVALTSLKSGKQPVLLLLKGVMTTDGITFLSGEYGDKHSIGIRLDDPQDESGLAALTEKLDAVDPECDWSGWQTREVFKNGVVYLKCRTTKDGKAFTFDSNVKLVPKKPNPTLMREMPVEVQVEASAYFGLEDTTRGISFRIRNLQFLKEAATTTNEEEVPEEAKTPPAAPKKQVSRDDHQRIIYLCGGCGTMGDAVMLNAMCPCDEDGARWKELDTWGEGNAADLPERPRGCPAECPWCGQGFGGKRSEGFHCPKCHSCFGPSRCPTCEASDTD